MSEENSRSKAIWALIGVETMSFLGSEIARFGISIWVYRATNSVTDFAFLVLANSLPGLLISPFAGSFVDRYPRKWMMLGASFVSLVGTLIVLSGAAFGRLSMPHIVCGAILASLGEGFQWPALSSSVPLMTDEKNLPRVNGFLEAGRALSMLAGPVLGGVFIGMLGLSGLLALEVTTFLIAAIVVFAMVIPNPSRVAGAEVENLWQDALFGLKWIWSHQALLRFLGVAVFANFFINIGIVLMTPFGLSILDERSYGIANGLFGGGMIVGGIAYGFLSTHFKNITLVMGSSLLVGVLYFFYGFARGLVPLAGVNFLFAALMTVANAGILTIWQLRIPQDCSGRVLSAVRMIAYGTGPISYLLAGPLAEQVVPFLFSSQSRIAHWLGTTWGFAKTGEMGFLFSSMGVILFIGFAAALLVEDIRKVEER